MSPDTLETLRTVLSSRYRVERLLGSGGMATVYLAQDLKHDRPVAIKVLRPELAVALGPERFLREIQIAAKLNHPHILALHDSGDAGGLLYYVMPYVAGESVHHKLLREKRLSIEEALRVTREVAAALSYAHGQGVVHRDIKPANILLSAGYALVADFGLARAISRATSGAPATQPWLALGTPDYMSPEQVTGDEELDGRSDVYSLGCVLYELLAGNPPFTASNPGSILLRQRSMPPPPIRSVRADVPEFVEAAIGRALEKSPADRFQTAEEFAAALGPEGIQGRARALPKWVTYAAFAVAAAAIVVAVVLGGGAGQPRLSLDTARYAVLPFLVTGDSSSQLGIEQLVHDALARWDGLHVVDRFQVNDALARRGHPLTGREAMQAAQDLGAGRYLRGEVTRAPDGSSRVQAVLFEAAKGRELKQGSLRIPAGATASDSLVGGMVDNILFGGTLPANREEAAPGTHSAPARQAYARGHAAITNWDLAAADTAFSAALGYDAQYAHAALWLALSRQWAGRSTSSWRYSADQAEANRARLSSRDRQMADALAKMGEGDYGTACPIWNRLSTEEPNDFAVWYGLGTCLTRDSVVVRDSRVGWRFRSSRNQAQNAYQTAFRLLPSMHRGLRAGAFLAVRRLLILSLGSTTRGYAARPDTGAFIGRPAWEGDTLVLVAYREEEVNRGQGTFPSTALTALAHQRQAFYEIMAGWATKYPESPDALEGLGLALELLGNSTALDTVRRGRQLARDSETRTRLAATEAWMRLRLSLPNDLPGLRTVRAVVDSLLSNAATTTNIEAGILAPLASLLGQGYTAAQLSRRANDRRSHQVPVAVAGDAEALLVYSALGGPADSLRALETRLDGGISQSMDPGNQVRARLEWIGYPASMAYPNHRFRLLASLAGHDDYLINAEVALERGDRAAARSWLDGVRKGSRAFLPPSEIMLDGLLPETELLVRLGATEAVVAALDSTLLTQRFAPPNRMASVAQAGMLVRAMAWRAEYAAKSGDGPTARLWASPVAILWANADDYLRGTVQRMVQLSAH